jgi:deoxycytidylate deaminase
MSSSRLDLDQRVYPNNGGELFFAFVSPSGTNEKKIMDEFESHLKARDYNVVKIKLSSLISNYSETSVPTGTEFDRIIALQNEGNILRNKFGCEVLAALGCTAAAESRARGEKEDWFPRPKKNAYFFSSLKHPDEAALLRTIYGHGFYLIAIHSSYNDRISHLMKMPMSEIQAKEIMERDDKQAEKHGQNTRETFELADFYLSDSSAVDLNVSRFVKLIFGALYLTPTKEEYGMYMAYCASHRSSDLSRQVGAAILDTGGDLVAAGCNEVPKFGGGSYWPDDNPDFRDFALGNDPNEREKTSRFNKLLETLKTNGVKIEHKDLHEAWIKSGLKDITEFGRTVHAEMDTILACLRKQIDISGTTLFSTTFPCHNCARHIIASGISKVIYIEPYAKSEAISLYGDSIVCRAIRKSDRNQQKGGKQIPFDPFEGVAPRRFGDFFGMRQITGHRLERKTGGGTIINQNLADLKSPRLRLSEFSYLQREEFAVDFIKKTILEN